MNAIALAFIKAHEGCRLIAYPDTGGTWTIGYGATGKDIIKGVTWTQEEADARLERDVDLFEAAVRRHVATSLSDRQMAALISFTFNLGEASLRDSTLLVKLNQGDLLGAAKEFPRWDHDNGREVKGVLIRRFEEAALFLRGSVSAIDSIA
jgi:lysozyme